MKSLFDQVSEPARDLLKVDAFRPPGEVPPSLHGRYREITRQISNRHPSWPVAKIREEALVRLAAAVL